MKEKIIILVLGIMSISGVSIAQNIDPYMDDAYYSQKEEKEITQAAKERAAKEYQRRMAIALEQRRQDSIEYAKYISKLNSDEIDAYNGHLKMNNTQRYADNNDVDDNTDVYGEYSSRIKMFHHGQDVIINNPSNVNIYRDSYDYNGYYNAPWRYNRWGYSSWYSPYNSWNSPYVNSYYPWYDSYYPWYDNYYSYYGYYSPTFSFGWGYYPYGYSPYYWDRYYYGYSPYSYDAGYYNGYYSGVYNTTYVTNRHRNGNRSYQSYGNRGYYSPIEAVRGVARSSYNNSYQGDDGYHYSNSRVVGNNRGYSNNRYNNANRNGYTRSYRENYNNSNRSYNYNSSSSHSNSSSGNRSYRSYNNSSSSGSSGYTRHMRR